MKRHIILLTAFAMVFQCCGRVYYPADFTSATTEADTLAQKHHLIAVAPPKVSIESSEDIDIRALLFQQESLSRDFQKETYNWLLKRKKQGRVIAEIQNPDTSNARLRRAGYYKDSLLSVIDFCQTLGVDGVITTDYLLDRPMTEGQTIITNALGAAIRVIFGLLTKGLTPPLVHASRPALSVSISIHDLKSKKIIWKADNTLSVGVISPDRVVNGLLRSRPMPYIIK